MTIVPRVALFTDSYTEVNGVAHTTRQLAAFAERRGLPLLCVYGGRETELRQRGSVRELSLRRSPFSVALDVGLAYDTAWMRHIRRAREAVVRFGAEVVHITGPNDIGLLGALTAHRLRIPTVGSWHTNLHEFGASRMERCVHWLPPGMRRRIVDRTEKSILYWLTQFYRIPRVNLAPNAELIALLESMSGRPARSMTRGVDTTLFSPEKRRRTDGPFTLGFVGRLRAEKNVRFLAELEEALIRAGASGFRFSVVGDGTERTWLEQSLRHADFPGFLTGEPLARAYADMDLFVFPSRTDTFGNVVLEALASGVPALVTAGGGPKYIIDDGVNGYVFHSADEATRIVLGLIRNPGRLREMRTASREGARQRSWDEVFESVYRTYQESLSRAHAPQADGAALTKRVAAAGGAGFAGGAVR